MNAPAKVRLADCVRLAKGKPPAQQPYYGPGSAWYLTPEYLRGAATCESVKPSANAVHAQDGDTVLLWDGSNAGEVFLGREGILASTMTRVSPDSRFTWDYFLFALKRWESYLKGQTSGSGIPHVDKEILGKLEITEFAKPEQSKIAEVLSTVDRAIAQTEALIAKQQRIKTGLMQDLLTRGIDEHGQLRSEATHAFKDSPLGCIPVEWEVRRLDRVSEVKYGISDAIDVMNRYGIPTVTLPCVAPSGSLDLSATKLVFTPRRAVKTRDLLKKGDLLFNWRNGSRHHLGKTAYFNGGSGFTHVGFLLRIRTKPEFVDSRFLWYLINDIKTKGYFLNAKIQVNNTFNSNELNAVELAFPRIDEQHLIRDKLDSLENTRVRTTTQLEKLRVLKTALMQDLLTGKVRVTPLLQQAEAATA